MAVSGVSPDLFPLFQSAKRRFVRRPCKNSDLEITKGRQYVFHDRRAAHGLFGEVRVL